MRMQVKRVRQRQYKQRKRNEYHNNAHKITVHFCRFKMERERKKTIKTKRSSVCSVPQSSNCTRVPPDFPSEIYEKNILKTETNE